jgi:hypothetical protein
MKQRNILLILFIPGLLMCCDEYSDYQMIIDNNSLDTIKIVYSGTTAYTNGTDSIIALPGEKTIYYDAEGRTIKSKNFECDPQISKDEVNITTSSKRLLIKDISDKENWECETDSKNTYWKIIFQINETDLNK